MKLLIAIPALNEEDSIVSTIERCLAARERILRESPVTEVDVTVVSDGSTDGTVELAGRFADEIKLIVFEENQGYGAAIKAAWQESDADLLGLVDADGTCDPNVFAALAARAVADEADVVLGCRLNRASRMPLLRRVGNVVFALMLSFFSSQRVRDTSSGMRVVRRTSLPKLMPLPDGMHFTPAMSARAILSDDLKIVEVDMPYHERAGTSKLRVVKDGFRFLKVIVEAAFLYRPSRPLTVAGIVCGVAAMALMVRPTLYYLEHRAVLEWMIYRFVVSSLAATSALLLLSAAYLTDKIVTIVLSSRPETPRPLGWLGMLRGGRLFWLAPAAMLLVGGALVVPSLIELVRTGATYEHWSRFIAMSCLFSCALILVVARVFDYTLNLLAERVAYLKANREAEDGREVWRLLFAPQRRAAGERSSGVSA